MKPHRRPPWWITGLLLVLAVALLILFLPRPVRVDTARVTRGPLLVTVSEDGKTRVRERYVISSPLAGQIHRIALDAGDPVVAGKTVLVSIDPTDPELLDPRTRAQAEARVKAAEASRLRAGPALEQARTAAAFARTELQRTRRLFDQGAASQQELDLAEQRDRVAAEELKAAELAVQIAEYELEITRAALLRSQSGAATNESWRLDLHSPIDGQVLRVFQESAAVVAAGTHLLELGNPADLEVEVDLLTTDAVNVRPAARAWLEHWGGDTSIAARVRRVEPGAFTKLSALGVEEQRVNVVLDLVDPPDKLPPLGDGYRVEARIVVWEFNDVLRLPVGALFRQEDDWAVFAIEGGRARVRPVTLGHRNETTVELRSGLATGDTVIVHPGDRLRDGIRVTQSGPGKGRPATGNP